MPPISRLAIMLVGAVALGRGVPGCGTPSFVCEGDESCAGLDGGQCEADGHCSIPDADCASGRRYAAHSGDVSGQCVGELASSTAATQTTAATAASETDVEPPTSTADEGTSAPPVTTGGDPTAGSEEKVCGVAVMEDPFAMPPIDPVFWEVDAETGITVDVIADELWFSAINVGSATTDIGTAFPLPLVGTAGVELTTVPPPDAFAEVYFVLDDADVCYGFRVSEGRLELFYDDGLDVLTLATFDYDPVAHHWLQLSFDGNTERIAWEVAPTVDEWVRLEEVDLETGFDVEEATVYLGADVSEGPITVEPLAAFGYAFVCQPPDA